MLTIEQARELEIWQETALIGRARPLPKASALKALEEMIELAFACGASVDDVARVTATECNKAHTREYAYPEFPDQEEMEKEFGDVVCCLYMIAYFNQIPMTEAVTNTLMRISSREWTPNEESILVRQK